MNKKTRKVAVIGRPNVGKSTLFNRLLKERRSIVDDTPGVTRDRIYAEIDWSGKGITLIDTGGLVYNDEDEILLGVKKQVFSAIEESDFILFMVDGKAGLTSGDESIAKALRKIKDKKRIFLAVNKVDTEKQSHFIYDFYSLGFDEPIPISALSGSSGLADILDEIATGSYKEKKSEDGQIKIAIVGKPNVGKSSILNALIREERALVTSIAGTTRDCLDTEISAFGKNYTLIDTAGLRRKSKVSSVIERYSNTRTISAIERADIILLIVEACTEITDQDQKIAALIKKREKPSVTLINKWDLVENKSSSMMNELKTKIFSKLRFVNYSKELFTSAKSKRNLVKIWELINATYENNCRRISTSKLNQAVEEIILIKHPPSSKTGKQLKIYYVTQSGINPPEIVLFVNESDLIKKEYERFLEKELRARFDFSGTPIRLVFRNKKK